MLSKDLEQTLSQAFQQAREKQHEFMTVEHLLWALLDNPTVQQMLLAMGVDIARLRLELETHLDESQPVLADNDHRETQPSLGFQRVLQRAVFHVQSSNKAEVTGANVLVAIFGEQESHAVYLLNRIPNEQTERSPLELFSCKTWLSSKFQDFHVWGSPAYVLDSSLAGGKSIPQWKPRSSRSMYR